MSPFDDVANPHEGIASTRVLVIRCARAPIVADAIAAVRRELPGASIDVLSHRGHGAEMKQLGATQVIEIGGRRFGLMRISPWQLARLRRASYTHILVPRMMDDPIAHANVHALALAIGASTFFTYCAASGLQCSSRERFAEATRRQVIPYLLRRFDTAMMLALQLLAIVWPVRRAASTGRRRVLHIIPSWGVGGAQVQLAEVVNQTPRDQYDVSVLIFTGDQGDFSSRFLRADVPVHYSDAWPVKFAIVLEVARHCRRERIDVVHCWLCLANAVGIAGARLGGVPLTVAAVRNLNLWKRAWYRQWWLRWADILSARAADVVTVNGSGLVADHAQWARLPVERIRTVPNGLDPAVVIVDRDAARASLRRDLQVADETILVGTVGRLAPEKDQALLLRAFAQLPPAFATDACRLVLAGDGQLRAALEALAADLWIANRVHFLGTRGDARQVIAGLDLFVLPSIIEGFPNALLEAVMNGIPAVASAVGGTPDILPDPVDLVPVGDVTMLTARIAERVAALDVARARARGLQLRALDLFTGERTTRRWLDLYAGAPSTPGIALAGSWPGVAPTPKFQRH